MSTPHPTEVTKMTPEQALGNLETVSELYSCDGRTRDALRESVRILRELLPVPSPEPAPSKV